ncbi:ubiquitin conjugating enzyme E2 L3 [Phyllostomus discolor]|uniref:Ubiquitin conjugating enzyme E2 L3 n=1 Tax=Phyllostomus discolor TaxID=89673 RepID=A0A833YVF4_9CHIR|nr:ubiquitin conjugating enzyme E2 L3 [Phyllostomus discolor]
MAASRRLMKELEEIRKCGMKNFRNIQVDEANLLTWQGLIVPDNPPYDKGAFKIKINFPAEYPFKPPRSHLKQRSITPTSMKRGRSVCQ